MTIKFGWYHEHVRPLPGTDVFFAVNHYDWLAKQDRIDDEQYSATAGSVVTLLGITRIGPQSGTEQMMNSTRRLLGA